MSLQDSISIIGITGLLAQSVGLVCGCHCRFLLAIYSTEGDFRYHILASKSEPVFCEEQ